jgi:predicted ribosome quality control (RQC) complex YloA/Tae2 family protein
MSLNWREIDLVLEELSLEGSYVQGILQPAFDALVLELYRSGQGSGDGRAFRLFVSLASGGCRIHETQKPILKTKRPLRFMEFLKKRIKGARIGQVRQLGSERIVRIGLSREDEELILWLRLWSNAANAILTDSAGSILDCMMRRPKKGEVSGGSYLPELPQADPHRPKKEFAPRDFPGEGSLSRRIEGFYDSSSGELSIDRLLPRVESLYSQKIDKIESAIASMEARLSEFSQAGRWKEYGDLLMSNPLADTRSGRVELDDFFRPGQRVAIPVAVGIDPIRAAEEWYEKAQKAKSGGAEVARELAAARRERDSLDAELGALRKETDPIKLERVLADKPRETERRKNDMPGIVIETRGWTIVVGKTAKENDALLRRHMRGSDLWLHARDYSGAYVFIKAQREKSVPLEVLLDAANLAIYHSKARSSGGGNLYYTQVKYLRRAKNGPLGLVLPTQEKNLSVKMDPERLRALKDSGNDSD